MSYTKKQLLEMTVTKLKEICKEKNIPGCYKYKLTTKDDLVEFILSSLKKASPKPKSPSPKKASPKKKKSPKKKASPKRKSPSPKRKSPSPKKKASPVVISKAEIGKMTVKQLKELLGKCGQPTSGLKAALVERVFSFVRQT